MSALPDRSIASDPVRSIFPSTSAVGEKGGERKGAPPQKTEASVPWAYQLRRAPLGLEAAYSGLEAPCQIISALQVFHLDETVVRGIRF